MDIWPACPWLPWDEALAELPCAPLLCAVCPASDAVSPDSEGLPWALDWPWLDDCDDDGLDAEEDCEDCELDWELDGELDCELLDEGLEEELEEEDEELDELDDEELDDEGDEELEEDWVGGVTQAALNRHRAASDT